MMATGIFLSKMSYLIQIWGGTNDIIIKALQVSQNAAARTVTRLSWFTHTRTLLRQCGWLSVRQMVFYHTALTTHKIVREGRPQYIHSKMCTENTHNTRHEVKFDDNFGAKSVRAKKSFCYRGAVCYNQLPLSIQSEKNNISVKKKLKGWTMKNIEVQ